MKKLVCDKCGMELTEKYDMDQALAGMNAWATAARARGAEPRGVIPCGNFIRCDGEMILVNGRRTTWWRRGQ